MHSILTHHFVDVLLDQLHSPGLCDHPPGLLRVEPHTLGYIVPGEIQWNYEVRPQISYLEYITSSVIDLIG